MCVWASPLEEQLDEGVGAGEGPVGGQEDAGVVALLVLGVQQVADQTLQGGSLEPAHLRIPNTEGKGRENERTI